ncbi:uncharacterized protein LOC112904911 [Agrilus planipennis]|uniref:Uncharacterized protein LOC112904911 n=1 Tax=Agrilus planipennis TaxID=224129 RepID=A0A7F5R7H6_AGRPL|nr:uncharacterized protein LOC112904911 [Agrilus planipennis]
MVNEEKYLFNAINKCNTNKKSSLDLKNRTQTSLPTLNEETLTKNEFTQTCKDTNIAYQQTTTFTATSNFDLYIKLKDYLNMVESLKNECTSHCNFRLYESNNKCDYEQVKLTQVNHSIKADRKIFTNACKKNGRKKWQSNQKYYCPRNMNERDNFLKSGFMFMIKNNEESRSQRVLISFDTEMKNLKVNHSKKKTIQKHISEVLTENLFRNNIHKKRDLIESESEPSLMSQVSTIRIENSHEFPYTNCKIVPEIKSKHNKTTNENVNNLNNNDGEKLKTEYLYLSDSFRWNKTSSNVIKMTEIVTKPDNVFKRQEVILASDSEHLNSFTTEGFKKQEKSPYLAKAEKLIHEKENKREPKKFKGKKLTFQGLFRFLRIKSKS